MVTEKLPTEIPNNIRPIIIVSKVNIIVIPVPTNPMIILINYARLLPLYNILHPMILPIIIPKKIEDSIIVSHISALVLPSYQLNLALKHFIKWSCNTLEKADTKPAKANTNNSQAKNLLVTRISRFIKSSL